MLDRHAVLDVVDVVEAGRWRPRPRACDVDAAGAAGSEVERQTAEQVVRTIEHEVVLVPRIHKGGMVRRDDQDGL